ncbi:MAG: lipid II flippase MurJ [Terriglobia bacterium]|jgi:putative peptidoglycan lipid II flippase
MDPKQQMLRSSVVVAFFNLLGGLTGILVETSIAANLGLSIRSDTFYVAYTIPYIITNLLTATGQFSLVPFFASLESTQDEDELGRGFSYVANILFLGLGAIALVGIVASPWIMHGIAPGFTHQEDEIATQLSRWLFLIIIPAGLGEVLRSFLLSRHYFALSTASGFIRNVSSIVIIVLGFHRFGVYSIVIGYMAGYLLQLLILGIPVLVVFPVRYSLTLRGSGESFRNLRGAGTAQLSAAVAWQGVVVVERIIASFLPAGTLTALNYGFKIQGALTELLGGSVGTAALPALSRAVARKDHEEERATFRETLRISLVLLSPMAVFCLLLNHSIIRLFFQRGNFTPEATRLMAMVLFYYSLSLLPYAFIRILSFHMFARLEGGLYLRLALFLYGLNVGFDLLYTAVFRLGAKGIPLGLLSSALVTAWLTYQRDLCELRNVLDRSLAVFSSKIFLGVTICAVVVGAMQIEIPGPASGLGDFGYLCLLCGVGSLAFFIALVWTRALPKAWGSIFSKGAEGPGSATSSVQ